MSSPDNKCGSCTACCRVFAIPEFDKPAGKWCEHCTVGKQCNIYETRPKRCVEFKCMWLQSQAYTPMADDMRPDRCKVVFSPSTSEKVMTAITMPGAPDAWRSRRVLALIGTINKAGLSVAIGPPNSDAQLVIKPDGRRYRVKMSPPDEDGMQWSSDPKPV